MQINISQTGMFYTFTIRQLYDSYTTGVNLTLYEEAIGSSH